MPLPYPAGGAGITREGSGPSSGSAHGPADVDQFVVAGLRAVHHEAPRVVHPEDVRRERLAGAQPEAGVGEVDVVQGTVAEGSAVDVAGVHGHERLGR
ncbi:hypothetical protein [Blastococcus deserti]|uniref:Uncharacterized protein n=1 Tax=Blastococcus deserti TaxID=2259033 RepID=A0ABW4X587_9ACTN